MKGKYSYCIDQLFFVGEAKMGVVNILHTTADTETAVESLVTLNHFVPLVLHNGMVKDSQVGKDTENVQQTQKGIVYGPKKYQRKHRK